MYTHSLSLTEHAGGSSHLVELARRLLLAPRGRLGGRGLAVELQTRENIY